MNADRLPAYFVVCYQCGSVIKVDPDVLRGADRSAVCCTCGATYLDPDDPTVMVAVWEGREVKTDE